ncbi:hypothetical protein KM043_017903 [Ampulex compressa]|nr:hypothetical protein KM043_017903 [Ampulex compressa]
MGINVNGGFSNLVHCEPELTWEVPKEWTMQEAATVPCVYATCYYALYISGKIKKGDAVLIHAGSGGVGQAAIHLALYEGCEVFTTVGTPEKRRFIKETFPSIDDKHIGDSRSTSFEQMVRQETNGRGVDIVLNSLTEDMLQASLRCLAPKGRFLEIGKFDAAANNSIGMQLFLKEISLHGIMLDNMIKMKSEDKLVLNRVLSEGILNGAVKPLINTVFKRDEIELALRYMAAGKHIGKVLLQIHESEASLDAPIPALPRFNCHCDRSYLIIGGLGGFGLELADWLVLRGAKYLILVSRNGITNGYQRARTELWKSYGVELLIIVGLDLSTEKDCKFLLMSAEKKAPVDGIFNVAVVLKDNICTKQTPESFEESFKPKAWTTKRLDEVSRKLCPMLRHFVVFSSISCGRGNAEQTNYGMSNSVMERICEKRVEEGFPGLAIQWGAVGHVGLLADLERDDKSIVIGGTLQQSIFSCLKVLDELLLQQEASIVGSMVVAEKCTERNDPNSIVNTVLNIMGIKDLKGISHEIPLAELGMDSIIGAGINKAANGHDTVTDMVNYRLPHILETLQNTGKFLLVGYSFGAVIAIELAQRLEVLGLSGQLILIDGSPELVTTFLKQNVQSSAEIEHLIFHKALKRYNPGANISEFALNIHLYSLLVKIMVYER